ncbi:ComEA family DNA-binding protein [Marinospirillum alkaliphilum]|uniref:Helix-hairpin-helix motif-containing protein n=1 Tax=Marinospirillum alkaliphilum DSM 21637 TaxID=1122209 RepID=A0A1K1YJR4_9GAMM|nr:helix-hairpin-helix domain-containing protein [Marinospirillum alkaliphilum]SFX62031.1 Helix-hairpin-helix motif-containing protein [Marinospirillum alkaliphilum DSM 21637]
MQGIRFNKLSILLCTLLLTFIATSQLHANGLRDAAQNRISIAQQSAERINVNTASAEQLAALPGIGPSRAEAIIALRNEKGSFTNTNELQQIRGIGAATAARLEPLISF